MRSESIPAQDVKTGDHIEIRAHSGQALSRVFAGDIFLKCTPCGYEHAVPVHRGLVTVHRAAS